MKLIRKTEPTEYYYKPNGKREILCWFECPVCHKHVKRTRLKGVSKYTCSHHCAANLMLEKKKEQLVNTRYNRLTILDIFYVDTGQRFQRAYAKCVCDCGQVKDLRLDGVLSGHTTSCGDCNGVQGDSGTLLHKRWEGMRSRCNGHEEYSEVEVCDEWVNNYQAFKEWALDNGWDEEEGRTTPHRIHGAPLYSPETCELVTLEEHAQLHNYTGWFCKYRKDIV